MNNFLSKLSTLKQKFLSNRHMQIGVPFILAVCIGPTLMQSFVEIQFLFGKTGNADRINEEIMKKHGPRRTRDEILREGYKELIADRRDQLENWEPVRINRFWEDHDDTFKHYVTKDDLRLKD